MAIGDKRERGWFVRKVPFAAIAPQHDRRKKKDHLAAALPKSDQGF